MNKQTLHVWQTPSDSPPISEDYSDIIVRRQLFPFEYADRYAEQNVDEQYSILYAPLSEQLYAAQQIGYSGVPKLFTFLSTASLEASGILAVQTQPYLNLRGKGVLVGFIDSGIDYTHFAFRKPDGTTRILGIWDQTDQTGDPPQGLAYGTEYSEAQINEALRSPTPSAVVPEQDETGHGTAVAGIACGSADPQSEFTGTAPESSLLFVRLKPAKQYLRDYFMIPDDAYAFQENDIMLGIRYLVYTAARLQMPLILCMTLGTNQGDHTGNTPLEQVLTTAQLLSGIYGVTGTGNEAGAAHHYYGKLARENEISEIELLISEPISGITLEFWAEPFDLYNIGFTSPLGESIQPVYHGPFTFREFHFSLENTVIYVYYSSLEIVSGQQVILIRIVNPSTGVWRLRVSGRSITDGAFHFWLPISGLNFPGVSFTAPNPDTTLVIPSCPEPVITVGAYNADDGSLFRQSGRGFTRNGIIKPDFASPGVALTAPSPGGSYRAITGSSASSALTAGSVALLTEWNMQRFPKQYFTSAQMKNILLRGLDQNPAYFYPNREWGNGTLSLYRALQRFGQS